MKQIHQIILLMAALAAISMTVKAQDTYAHCSTNYTVLEDALFETSDNLYRMSTTYFSPEYVNPVYVDVFYHFGDTNESAHYIWSDSSLYLIVPPSTLQHISLFFTYFERGSTAKLNLQLPGDCIDLKNVTTSSKHNFLFVLTQRLRILAKHYRSLDLIALHDDFEARVVSCDEQEKKFIKNPGTIVFFTFFLILPTFACIFLVVYVFGVHSRASTLLKKTNHHSTQAALVCVGQSFTLYVIVMDVIAVIKNEIATYMSGIIICVIILEVVLFLLITVAAVMSCIECECSGKYKEAFTSFCKFVNQWFVIFGLIPSLVCVSSHVGFVIEGWVSSPRQGTAAMFLYSFIFAFLFLAFQSIYSAMNNTQQENEGESLHEPGGENEREVQPLLGNGQKFSFCTLLFEFSIGIPILAFVAYIGYGFYKLPIIRGSEDAVNEVYNFGHTVFFLVLILLYHYIQKFF